MGGSFIQLFAIGAQNIYLTGNPQITFFKMIYKRYTHFAIETFDQKTIGDVDYGKRFSILVSKKGDLISNCSIKIRLQNIGNSDIFKYEAGHQLLKSIEIQIGGKIIDKHYGSWLSIWKQLSTHKSKQYGHDELIGGGNNIYMEKDYVNLQIPLQFWFCRYTGLALPLIALQYHEVKFIIELNQASDVYTSGSLDIIQTSLLINYIILDTDERRRMVSQPHEYLIEQLQYQQDSLDSSTNEVPIKFSYPIKELIWTYQFTGKQHNLDFSTGDESTSPLSTSYLEINGVKRFIVRDGRYFNEVQPYQHHTNIPEKPGIYVYSFSLNPEKHQPSGSLNFSRLNEVKLFFTLIDSVLSESKTITIYGINYNILKIMSGMGGLSYT